MIQIQPKNNKKQSHGLWIRYNDFGKLWYKGQYISDLKHGYWILRWLTTPKITFHLK